MLDLVGAFCSDWPQAGRVWNLGPALNPKRQYFGWIPVNAAEGGRKEKGGGDIQAHRPSFQRYATIPPILLQRGGWCHIFEILLRHTQRSPKP